MKDMLASGVDTMDERQTPLAMGATSAADARIAFLIRLAKALHKYGVPAHRLEGVLRVLSEKLGIVGSVYSSPTAIFASFGEPAELRTAMVRVEPGEMDLGRLVDLDTLTSEVLYGERSPQDGLERLDEILEAPPLYGPLFTLLCSAMISTGASVLLGGQGREIAAAFAISLWIGPLLLWSAKSPTIGRIAPAMGAFGAALIAAGASLLLGNLASQQAIIAGLIPLLPGLTLTIGMTELATGNLVSGTTRFTSAVLVLLQLAFGVALGTEVGHLLPSPPALAPWAQLPDWIFAPSLIVATAATSVLFRAKPKDTVWVVAAGVLSFNATRMGAHWLGLELSAFVGSLVLCMGSNVMARNLGKPATLTIVPGLLLLVPGSIGYRSFDAMRGHDITSGIEIAFTMGLIAISLVMGLLIANVLVPPRKVL